METSHCSVLFKLFCRLDRADGACENLHLSRQDLINFFVPKHSWFHIDSRWLSSIMRLEMSSFCKLGQMTSKNIFLYTLVH